MKNKNTRSHNLMITVSNIKEYLYIPSEVNNDDVLISTMVDTAYSYLRGAVDNFDDKYETDTDFANLADAYATIYVAELYQNRNQFTESGAPSFLTRALITQIQLYTKQETI
jgi:uncharacterized phage protein (predicted DNA packaging)